MKKNFLAPVLILFLVSFLGGIRQAGALQTLQPESGEILAPTFAGAPQTIVADLTLCVSNGKTPPIGGARDVHVKVTNNGSNIVTDLKLMFAVEGKGIQDYHIASLGPGITFQRTRNHSWSTVGTKTITAMVFKPGYKEQVKVEGAFRVRLAGTPSDSSGEGDKCVNGRIMTPVDKPALDLTVCISDGHTPAIGQKRDIHVWVKNNGAEKVEKIKVTFFVEGKSISTIDIPSLEKRTTKKITRNHSWSTVGTKSLSANVTVAGQTGVWSVFGAYRVRLAGTPSDSSGETVKCSDNSAPVNFR